MAGYLTSVTSHHSINIIFLQNSGEARPVLASRLGRRPLEALNRAGAQQQQSAVFFCLDNNKIQGLESQHCSMHTLPASPPTTFASNQNMHILYILCLHIVFPDQISAFEFQKISYVIPKCPLRSECNRFLSPAEF